MKAINVIQKAILSEKAYKLMESGIYSFLVERHATKKSVASAVKNQFGVDSIKVNISHVLPKSKRITGTRKHTTVGGGKKALVYLTTGQSISILSPKADIKKGQKSKKAEGPERSRRDKDVQVTSPEGKEG